MLTLPMPTEINKQLPKNAIFQKLILNTAQKESFDRDISRIYISNEISDRTINIEKGETVDSIFVLLVHLKRKEYADKNIAMLSKMIERNIVYVMEFEKGYQLGVYYTKLIKSNWTASPALTIAGLNLDAVWENFVRAIRNEELRGKNEELGVRSEEWDGSLTLGDNILRQEEKMQVLKRIAQLEKQARGEKQPKKKFEIVQEIKRLREGLWFDN